MSEKMQSVAELARSVFACYPVRRAAFFGSIAREESTADSDMDILVEFLPGTRGIEFFGLKVDLEEALQCPVDLLTYNALQTADENFKRSVESELVLIYEQCDLERCKRLDTRIAGVY